ncbi:hypothetical protein [Colwellia sp. Bg11-28]|uniref:hypothetical protein n=1 Tax=Colwellia sp. Bg11-28 TaxID=2058305 RepID=UPI000C31BD5E|nr:hypothetical protein [Colwellia sp. Bg11-28]PKH88855.1 hypothetical protein CXF79_02925 [Colwellia sp. Bg11-28]
MSKVIKVLEKMASDASLISKADVSTMLIDTEITERQKLAIEARDLDTLTETIHDLPIIKCIPIVPAEDDDEADSEKETQQEPKVKIKVV